MPDFHPAMFILIVVLLWVPSFIQLAISPDARGFPLSLVPAVLGPLILSFVPRWTLRIGRDGVVFRRALSTRFVPWADFEGFHGTRDFGVRAKVRGRLLRIGLPRDTERTYKSVRLFLERLNEKVRERRGDDSPEVLRLLEGHDPTDWPGVLSGARTLSYRTQGITELQLLDALHSSAATPEMCDALTQFLQGHVSPATMEAAAESFACAKFQREFRARIRAQVSAISGLGCAEVDSPRPKQVRDRS